MAFALAAGMLSAQTAETIPYRAVLQTSNEVPPVALNASGTATVWLHVVRDVQGRVTSASTDFEVNYMFPGETRITGLHIHRGNAGENGGIVIDSGISAAQSVTSPADGRGSIQRQGQSTTAANIEAVNGILANPAGFYVNMHTPENPGGVMRGQLQRADMIVLMGLMNPQNETPPIPDNNANGIASVVALVTRGDNGAINSGRVIFDLNYRGFTEGTRFTGFHIHSGAAGVPGGVTINTGISAASAVPAVVAGGNLHYDVEVPLTAAAVDTLTRIYDTPHLFYVNLHSEAFPGGVIRGQLRFTDWMKFQTPLSPANEVPPLTIDASAPSTVSVYTIRNPDSTVAAGTVIFDVNHRFPANTTFTGLHIHNGVAGMNGGVVIDSRISSQSPVVSESGAGNIFRMTTVSTDAGIAALNSLVRNPENHYLNLHTSTNPGGAVRAQLAAPNTALPTVMNAISAVSDPSIRRVAPGGLMTVFGTNLVKLSSNLGGSFAGTTLPTMFNGTSVTIGDKGAALLIVQPDYIVAQVPMDAPRGMQPVVVRNSNGNSTGGTTVEVAAYAPALYFDAESGLFTDLSYNLFRSGRRVRPGATAIAFSTGLGATTPVLTTGQLPTATLSQTGAVTVRVAGREAQTVFSVASPGYAGLYSTGFVVPEGTPSGMQPVTLTIGGVTSNSVLLPVE